MMRDLEGTQAVPCPGGRRRSRGWLPLALALVLAVVGLSLTAVACGGDAAPPVEPPPDDVKVLGPADAAVTVVEYADFQ